MEFEEVENIGQRIKEIRKSKSITIQKLSQFTDLSVGYLSNLERNQASPTLNNLQRICVALGISIRDLLSPSGEERTLIRQEEQQLYEYDEYKLQIRRLDFGKKRGIYEFSTYESRDKRYTAVLGAASIRGGRSHSGRQDGGQSGWNGLSLRTGRFDLYQAESLSHDAECRRYSLPLLLASADYG